MYHSHSYQDAAFDLFVTFLINAKEGDQKYIAMVQPVIGEAHELAVGLKNYYNIDRDNYSIILYLVESDMDYFKNLNAQQLKEDDYEHILTIANSQRQAFLAE